MNRILISYNSTSLEVPEGEFIIGRSTECHLVLDDPSVSRVHAAIVRRGDELFAEDKGSRNGVRVNRDQIKGTRLLQDGDQVVIGHQIIRITIMESDRRGEKTMAIQQCLSCGVWVSGDAPKCAKCGALMSIDAPTDFVDDTTSVTEVGRPPFSMLLEVASKAIQVNKLEEAERLMQTVVATVFAKISEGIPIKDSELNEINAVIIALAEATKSSEQISRLFAIHFATKKLMSRDLVERLYDLVRFVGYLSCPDMTCYLTFLDANAESLSPGDRFIHRRLQGLVKLCS